GTLVVGSPFLPGHRHRRRSSAGVGWVKQCPSRGALALQSERAEWRVRVVVGRPLPLAVSGGSSGGGGRWFVFCRRCTGGGEERDRFFLRHHARSALVVAGAAGQARARGRGRHGVV
ncbi:unnamed protein product, partial [Ectocarpus sp. 12 AP-2014]